jgi:beta-glucanase (GH16 family)
MGWLAFGKIQIEEYKENDQNIILGLFPYSVNYGDVANSNTAIVLNTSPKFHDYDVLWTEKCVNFYEDANKYFTFSSNVDVACNQDFLLVPNTAMGGSFGVAINADLNHWTFEFDYTTISNKI